MGEGGRGWREGGEVDAAGARAAAARRERRPLQPPRRGLLPPTAAPGAADARPTPWRAQPIGRRARAPPVPSLSSSPITLYSFFSTLTTLVRVVTRTVSPRSFFLYSTRVLTPLPSGPVTVGGGRMSPSSSSASPQRTRADGGAAAAMAARE